MSTLDEVIAMLREDGWQLVGVSGVRNPQWRGPFDGGLYTTVEAIAASLARRVSDYALKNPGEFGAEWARKP